MEQIIQQLTEDLSSNLSEDKSYYKIDDLRKCDFPRSVRERIRVEIKRKLRDSLDLPDTDWANMDSQLVLDIWQQFIEALREESWLPREYAHEVIETAVSDVLRVLVQPRRNIPAIIFGDEQILSLEEINRRIELIVVHRYFAVLLPRYMEKKNMKNLTKERCSEIIRKADQKLTARYSPLKWARMLDPLFELFDEQVDSNLFRLFYEDKNMPRFSRKFDFIEEPIGRARFIEELSSPDLLNLDGYEEDQSDLFVSNEGDRAEMRSGQDEESGEEDTSVFRINLYDILDKRHHPGPAGQDDENQEEDEGQRESSTSRPGPAPYYQDEESEEDEIIAENPITAAFQKSKRRSAFKESEEGEEEKSISERFVYKKREQPDQEQKEANIYSINDRYLEEEPAEEQEDESAGEISAGDEPADESKNEIESEKSEESERSAEEEENSEDREDFEFTISGEELESIIEVQQEQQKRTDTPMWQRFMTEEEIEEIMSSTEEEDREEEEAWMKDDIEDLLGGSKGQAETPESPTLESLLEDDRDYFVEELFQGSDQAYEQSLREIASKEDWRSASEYIKEEVFKRNLVDMYSEAAVSFTDRLQDYFTRYAGSDEGFEF